MNVLRLQRLIPVLLCAVSLRAAAQGQMLIPPQSYQSASTVWNLQSFRGVPISATANSSAGSDGRMPTANSSYSVSGSVIGSTLSPLQATANQFQSVYSFGGVSSLANGAWQQVRTNLILNWVGTAPYHTNYLSATPGVLGTNTYSGSIAQAMQSVPVALVPGAPSSNLVVALTLRNQQLGGAFFAQLVNFNFGDVVSVPTTDENGSTLTNTSPSDYWLPYPAASVGTYFSPHSGKIYAVQPGQISVTWIKAAATNNTPFDYATNSVAYMTNGGSIFRTLTKTYNVTALANKPVHRVYWTEKNFQSASYPVSIPPNLVGAIRFAYNTSVPQNVSSEYLDPNTSQANTNQTYQETRTLWYDPTTASIHAYNAEGRVFLELLGDLKPDGMTRNFLGYEIVDVVKQPSPSDLQQDLGDQLVPLNPGDLVTLTPWLVQVPLQNLAKPFAYANSALTPPQLYAVAPTVSQNDCLVHWLKPGVAGILWPEQYIRYKLTWPADSAKYSHYIRPQAASANEAQLTSVVLPGKNNPYLQFQDITDSIHGAFTFTGSGGVLFYTFLSPDYPAHRSLIRYMSGPYVSFERVFSWLDSALLDPNNNLPLYNPVFSSLLNYSPLPAVLTNPSFETDNASSVNFPGYRSITGWQSSSGSIGVNDAYNMSPFNNNGSVPDGGQVAFIQGSGSIEQLVSGLTVGAVYTLHYYENARNMLPSTNLPLCTVLLGGKTIVTQHPVSTVGGSNPFSEVYSLPFVAVSNNLVLKFVAGSTGGDTTLLLDNVSISGQSTLGSTNRFYGMSPTAQSPATLYAGCYLTNGVLHLVDAIPSKSGSMSVPDPTQGDTITNFNLTFNVLVGGGTPLPGGGFSVNLGTPMTGESPAEEGLANGLSVCFDLMQNAANDYAPGITVKFNGTTLAGVRTGDPTNSLLDTGISLNAPPIDPATGLPLRLDTAGSFAPVKIVMSSVGLLDVYYKGVLVLSQIPTGYLPSAGSFWLGARCESANTANVWMNSLSLVENFTGPSPFARSVAATLNSWQPDNGTFIFPTTRSGPNLFVDTARVGTTILPPLTEGTNIWVGYILTNLGNLYNPHAYIDPFAAGFDGAASSAIIPVNDTPGANKLSVLWFRGNQMNAALGFLPSYWPAALGKYIISYPDNPKEIVLASNRGSAGNGSIDPREMLGRIYYQNDPLQAGYNPNEEHAIMAGGTAYALRDDLNLTNKSNQTIAGVNYSSQPYVLVEYTQDNGSMAMTAYKVRREKPESGWVFDYPIPAGQLLQSPMPLPLLQPPVDSTGKNWNTEPLADAGADLPGGWATAPAPLRQRFQYYSCFTYQDRKHQFWVHRGPNAGLPPLQTGTYDQAKGMVSLDYAQACIGQQFALNLHSTRQPEYLAIQPPANMPSWLSVNPTNGLQLVGSPSNLDAGKTTLALVVLDLWEGTSATNTLVLNVVTSTVPSDVITQGPMVISSTNTYSGTSVYFTNRAPFLSFSAASSNSFQMQYYYPTDPTFSWPGYSNPPLAGTIVPYLRTFDPVSRTYTGGMDGATNRVTQALPIVYRPYWPEQDPSDSTKPVPTLEYGQTLVRPQNGLPGVGDWLTANVLYQQSVAPNIQAPKNSVKLFDPTRQKTSLLTNLPSSLPTTTYQGRIFFPTLPPHLNQRVFYDPNSLQLVFQGQFHDEPVGESYLSLNVMSTNDIAAVVGICSTLDTGYGDWGAAVSNLYTTVVNFTMNTNGVYAAGEDDSSYVTNIVTRKVSKKTAFKNKRGFITVVQATNITYNITYIPGTNLVDYGVSELPELTWENEAADSKALSACGPGSGYVTLVENGGGAFTKDGDPVALHVIKVGGRLHPGQIKIIAPQNPLSEQLTLQHTVDQGGNVGDYEYQWKIAAPISGQPPSQDSQMTLFQGLQKGSGLFSFILGGAGIQTLSDNYVTMRYRPINPAHPLYTTPAGDPAALNWSAWTPPVLAEGWIKRVLAGINPFNQRTKDLFNNSVNTSSSMLTQAGHRWEGDVALNLESLNKYGLIEIYDTVLRRGKSISINSGYDYGPANQALLLAAGYISDLYMMVGNEAWADGSNPTIGIGTDSASYGSIATSLFSFMGQEPSLLEEELALDRGRDDQLVPGVQYNPVYNRLVWNFTQGIGDGQTIYQQNYNITDQNMDGIVDATDASIMYPMGHGDAYGHYLTALSGYYALLMNPNFDWVPAAESVNVLGMPVSVNYVHERKFMAAAVALARTGQQVFDLTWRRDYLPAHTTGWGNLSPASTNANRALPSTFVDGKFWGADHWASRVALGGYVNWVAGNAILPDVDQDPTHKGTIQQVDRTTVPELTQLSTMANDLQTAMDNAEAGLNPLGMTPGSVALDIDPNQVVGGANNTHFEQIYNRALTALNNAVASFNDAKNVTELMRSQEDSLTGLQLQVNAQEQAFTNALIELYGTPYTDDIGAGNTYAQNYSGPDLIHYMYIDDLEFSNPNLSLWDPNPAATFKIDIQSTSPDYASANATTIPIMPAFDSGYALDSDYINFNYGANAFMSKPSTWSGSRKSPGKIQAALSKYVAAHDNLYVAITAKAMSDKEDLDKQVALFRSLASTVNYQKKIKEQMDSLNKGIIIGQNIIDSAGLIFDADLEAMKNIKDAIATSIPDLFVAGLAVGTTAPGDAAKGVIKFTGAGIATGLMATRIVTELAWNQISTGFQTTLIDLQNKLDRSDVMLQLQQQVQTIMLMQKTVMGDFIAINQAIRALADTLDEYKTLVAKGDQLQMERQVARNMTAGVIQGYRNRDAAFRVFRNEKLERYKTLFDMAARYSFLAANAYDFETGLLNTDTGRAYLNKIVSSRSLGVVQNGVPQYGGSINGDPGLSTALAQMKADWDVVKGRLGFNNPDAYGTTVSLRSENYRILPGTNGDVNWQDVLNQHRVADVMADSDVARYCMQISQGSSLAVPGIILDFSTTIAAGYNLFGQQLGAGDHNFSPSAFATKIFAAGVALPGYRGMDNPPANLLPASVTPPDPNLWATDPLALAATPYVYLIPCGQDSMRTPPLGDTSTIRTFTVDDVAIPLPFNIGAAQFATGGFYQTANALQTPLFAIRKHQAFRPVSDPAVFSQNLYGPSGTLMRSQYTNNRLIGRSVWNSRWKLVIPGNTLLNDSTTGLDRFIRTVTDIKLHFDTYSYSGN